MNFKRSGKTIFGVTLTSAEQKVVDREIEKQLAEDIRRNDLEIEAKVLWAVREEFGDDEAMLRRFYDRVDGYLDDLANHYEMGDEDLAWLCTKILKSDGIDIEAWHKENEAARRAK